MSRIIACQLTGIFFAMSHGKGKNDETGGDAINSAQEKVLQHKEVVGDLDALVTIDQKKLSQFHYQKIQIK